ncbi:MAG: hypothetical protein ABJG15_10875 [Hyphomonadaceae bacterium]
MSRIPSPSEKTHSRQQVLALGLCILALGLMVWRSVAIFTDQPHTPSTHPLAVLVETVVGTGNAQISETANGELLILLNGPVGAVDPAIAARLNDIVQTISSSGGAPVVRQFPFAQSPRTAPTTAELTELSALALLSMLGICVAFLAKPAAVSDVSSDQQARQKMPRPANAPTSMAALSEYLGDASDAPPFDTGPQPVTIAPAPESAGPRSLVDAQRFARANPDVTAKVIENWIRARGFKK